MRRRLLLLAVSAGIWLLGTGLAIGQTPVPGGTISLDTTWNLAGSPYSLQGTVTIAGTDGGDGVTTLTIEPGVEVRLPANASLTVGGTTLGVPGALIADGDAGGGPATIVFTSTSLTPVAGAWLGIRTQAGMDGSTIFRNVEIRYPGASNLGGVYANHTAGVTLTIDDVTVLETSSSGLRVVSGEVQLSNSTLRDAPTGDLRFTNSTSVSGSVSGCTLESVFYEGVNVQPIGWTNNTFLDYGAITSRIDPDDLGEFGSNGSFTKIGGAVTEVISGTVQRDATWTAAPAPYVTLGSLTVAGTGSVLVTLTLEPGIEIRMAQNSLFYIGGTSASTPGALIADGDATGGPATIRFVGNAGSPSPGYWYGMNTRNGMDSSTVLRNVEIRDAGFSNYGGIYANHAAGATLTVDDATILDSSTHGLRVNSGDLQLSNSTLRDAPSGDLRFANSTSVSGSVSGCTVESVYYEGTNPQPIGWSNNTFLDYGTVTSRIDPDDLGEFGSNGSFTKAGGAVTEVISGTVQRDATWTAAPAPYVGLGSLTVAGTGGVLVTLTLEPGVETRMAQNSLFYVGGTSATAPGALIADGDATGGPATIRFVGNAGSPSPGYWYGVSTRTGMDPSSHLRNVEIRDTGFAGYGGIYASHASGVTLVVDDATILDSSSYGIRITSGDVQVSGSTVRDSPLGDVSFQSSINASGSFSNCTLESVRYSGTGNDPIGWSNITLLDYGQVTSRIDPDDLGDLLASATITPVPSAVTEVLGGTVSRDASWTTAAAPYVALGAITVSGSSSVPATLTLEPGVETRFAAGAGLTVGGTSANSPGALIADGNAAGGPATIRFLSGSGSPAAGDWRGIDTRAGADASTFLRNVEIRHAGWGGYAGIYANHASATTIQVAGATIRDSSTRGIQLLSGGLQVSGSTIQSNATDDIYLQGSSNVSGSFSGCTLGNVFYSGTGAQPIGWSNNTFIDYGSITSRIDPDDLGEFVGGGSSFTSVPGAVTEVLAGSVTHDASWLSATSPYVALGTLTIQGSASVLATLTLEPGVELRFVSGAGMRVGGTSATSPGALIADGDAGGGPATVRFLPNGGSPAPGDWRGIDTSTGADPSTFLRNAEIRYAGWGGYAGIYAAHASGTTIQLSDVSILDSSTRGVHLVSGGLQLSDSTIQSNALGDLYFGNSSAVSGSISGCTLGSVFYAGTTTQPIGWANNTFIDYGNLTSRIDPDDLGGFCAGGTFTSVPAAVTEVHGGTVSQDATWTVDPAPYIALASLTIQGSGGIPATLTLEPGIEMRFPTGSGLTVGGTTASSPGALIADGDAAGGPATILLVPDSGAPTPGFWRGLNTQAGMLGSTFLRNVEIGYPGQYGYAGLYLSHPSGTSLTADDLSIHDSSSAGIQLLSGDLQLSNSTVQNSGNFDIWLNNASSISGAFSGNTLESVRYAGTSQQPITWTGNTFDNWGLEISKLRIADLDQFTHANTFNAVPGAVLEVFAGTADLDSAWGPDAGPLVFDGDLHIYGTDGGDSRTTLTLDPGVTVRVPPTRAVYVGRTSGDPGELIADGAPGEVFTGTINFNVDSDVPNAGDWLGLRVELTGRAFLREVGVRYATSGIRTRGSLGPCENVTVNRSIVGLELDQATLEGVLRGFSFRNCDVGVSATSTDATFRDGNLVGTTFGVENTTPGTHCVDGGMNFWGANDGPMGSAPAVGCETVQATGSGSTISDGVLFGSFLAQTPDDGDSIACDDGDGFGDPCTGGNTVDCDDNCCGVANESQSDLDGDGTGDACDFNPVLRVSSDPADLADFAIVQDAADVSVQSGTRIEILPGLGTYNESVRLDRLQVYDIRGVTNAQQDPIVIDGGSGPAFRVINKVGQIPMSFRSLTLRGDQGIRASVDTSTLDMIFDDIAGEALQLDGGAHTAERLTIGPQVGTGAKLEQGSSLAGFRVDVRGAGDAGFDSDGALALENALIAAGTDGVRLGANGSLVARYLTVTDNTGAGVDATAGGTVTFIDRSIVYDNALDDLLTVPCGVVSWSDTGVPDCSAGGNNISADPLLDAGYVLLDGSPCLDHGPHPSTYTGLPTTDLDGGVRLADYDGDGFAHNDCGAYEVANPSLVPGEVPGLRFEFGFRVVWDAEPDAVEYHIYRDLVSNMRNAPFNAYGVCRDDLDADRTDLQLDDFENPPGSSGEGFFYLVTAEAGNGEEGTLGLGSRAERSNFNACP